MTVIEYTHIDVILSGPDAPDEVHQLPVTLYACACGHEDADAAPAYQFPTCAACGQPVMPEREQLETEGG
jgi:hypothetical protein